MRCDIVIPLGPGSRWDNNELRYCLRSLEMNFAPLGNVYLMTTCQIPWLKNVHVINVGDPLKSNKDGNLINKVLSACDQPGLSDEFLRLSDDQLLISPVAMADEIKPYFLFNLKECSQRWWSGKWKNRMRRTMNYLTEHGLPAFHYDVHAPMLYNKKAFSRVFKGVDFRSDIGYCINTFYYNHVDPPEKVKMQQQKLTIEQPCTREQITGRLSGRKYMGYNDAGLNDDLKQILRELFPNKSNFEK
jgi:hypothetical protein